ncbi:MAG: mucin desulfatase [Ignavibacteriales bacterium CG18_big_fil_WC_8_21_14_2_50_31_20]|nr:MAG: mucin desulfatase [Ignavibacteriales bacterium CG18_big_fil_WC_8_21_14_2_50_31_20]
MVKKMEHTEEILSNFNIYGEYLDAQPYGSGHINDTILVTYMNLGEKKKYILRKINSYVFKDPRIIIENTINVTDHIRQKLVDANEFNINIKVLTLMKSKNGKYFYFDNKDYWCLIYFIEGAYTVDQVETKDQAYEAAKAYGKFQKYLSDFDTAKCHISIKDFHNLSNRINAFKESINVDKENRVKNIPNEISLAKSYENLDKEFVRLQSKNLPIRITHNDTKINNIMLQEGTSEGLCVVDLDTVMPGIILNDFGDMVRTFTSPVLEDEKDSSKVYMRLNIFDALVKGYLGELKTCLTEDEVNSLVLGAKIIVYEQAIRFLTDYISGDVYYKVEYDLHNLNRAKNQFALLASIEEQTSEMEKTIRKYSFKSTFVNEVI